jgi:hypothetical protein
MSLLHEMDLNLEFTLECLRVTKTQAYELNLATKSI